MVTRKTPKNKAIVDCLLKFDQNLNDFREFLTM